jgi:hypothetical protein
MSRGGVASTTRGAFFIGFFTDRCASSPLGVCGYPGSGEGHRGWLFAGRANNKMGHLELLQDATRVTAACSTSCQGRRNGGTKHDIRRASAHRARCALPVRRARRPGARPAATGACTRAHAARCSRQGREKREWRPLKNGWSERLLGNGAVAGLPASKRTLTPVAAAGAARTRPAALASTRERNRRFAVLMDVAPSGTCGSPCS